MKRQPALGFGSRLTVTALAFTSAVVGLEVAASASDHLYVTADRGQHYITNLYRYPLTASGLPSQTPDLKINDAGPAIAVAADGTIAAARARTHQINFYAPNTTKPERTLVVPSTGGGCPGIVFLSMAFDANDDLFVSWAGRGESCSAGGTYAYGPGASGHAKPLQSLHQEGALAVDTAGNLYVNTSGTTVVLANPTTNPTIIRTITGVYTLSGGIALVPPPYPRLWQYIVNGYTPNVLGQYYADESGTHIPINSIYTSTVDIAFTGFVAYWKGLIYGTFHSPTEAGLNVFNEVTCCLSTPLATLAAPNSGFQGLAVGP